MGSIPIAACVAEVHPYFEPSCSGKKKKKTVRRSLSEPPLSWNRASQYLTLLKVSSRYSILLDNKLNGVK